MNSLCKIPVQMENRHKSIYRTGLRIPGAEGIVVSLKLKGYVVNFSGRYEWRS